MRDDYRPIACGLHSQFELAAMCRTELAIETTEGERVLGRAVDVMVREGAEYLELLSDDGQRRQLRLDHIRLARDQESGEALRAE